jgi:hypothetical protein
MEDHTKETPKIMVEGPKFEMSSQYMKMHPRYFRDMLANKHEMTLCDLGAKLGDNSIHYLVGINEDAPIKVGEIKFDIYDKGSAFKFQPHFEVCNTFNAKYVPPHHHFIKKE